jgi:adenine phosphoribosyltransferase
VDLKAYIEAVPDFPQKGVLFRDITPLLADPRALAHVVDTLVARYRGRGVDKVLGIESRGFVFAVPLALGLGAGFIPVRKAGKLPRATRRRAYSLEYGRAELEIHRDAVAPGEKVVLVDDLLATGGTARAAAELVEEAGGILQEIVFVVELAFLRGREALGARPVHALVTYAPEES